MMTLLAQEDLLMVFSKYQSDPSSPVLTESNFMTFLAERQRAKSTEIDDAVRYTRKMKEPFRITKPTSKKEDQVSFQKKKDPYKLKYYKFASDIQKLSIHYRI